MIMGKLVTNKMSEQKKADCKKNAVASTFDRVTEKGNKIYKLESITQDERDKIKPYALGYLM